MYQNNLDLFSRFRSKIFSVVWMFDGTCQNVIRSCNCYHELFRTKYNYFISQRSYSRRKLFDPPVIKSLNAYWKLNFKFPFGITSVTRIKVLFLTLRECLFYPHTSFSLLEAKLFPKLNIFVGLSFSIYYIYSPLDNIIRQILHSEFNFVLKSPTFRYI